MRLHPRYFVTREAKSEFGTFFLELEKKHDLTYGELFEILSDQFRTLSASLVKEERDPEPVIEWTGDDKLHAWAQGWDVFENDEGELHLEALTDPVGVWIDAKREGEYSGPEHKTDGDAVVFVTQAAEEGDAVCRKAIELLIAECSPDVDAYDLQTPWKSDG